LAQSALERQIASIAAEAEGRVSVHLVESGKLSLDQPVRFRASDRILPQTYSPLRELLRLAVSLSDNAAADVVLRTIGGPAVVDAFFASSGGFHLEDNEAGLHRDHASQYRNWWEPAAAVALLRRLDEHSPLTPAHTALLFGWMQDSPSAGRRIGAELPAGAVVRHKSGTSFTERGLTAATNDIGLIALPDGRHLAVAIFVTDSKADEATRERVIARIARAAYDAAAATSK
jgi:beta-lactamase class A